MAAATPPPGRLQARLWQLRGLRVFPTGTARGQTWTEADIDAMAANGRKFGHLVRPTLVIGHEERQPLVDGMPATATQNTGEPAFGRLVNLRKEKAPDGTFLAVDAVDVPGWLAKLLAGKAFIDRSAEVYDDPPDGLEGAEGPILRRVSLLGGELPQWKTLGEMPAPEVQEFGERFPVVAAPRRPLRAVGVRRHNGLTVATFSERPVKQPKKLKKFSDLTPKSQATVRRFADEAPADGAGGESGPTPEGVSRQDMLDVLADHGVDVSAITDAVPDEALAEWVRSVTSQAAPEPEPPATPAEPAPPGGRMADDSTGTTMPPTTDYAAGQPKCVTLKYTENGKAVTKDVPLAEVVSGAVDAALKPVLAKLAAAEGRVSTFHEQTKKSAIDAELEALVAAGKVLPAEVKSPKDGGAGLRDRLNRADAVQKFADGRTELDLQLAELKARPVLLSFAERARAGGLDPAAKDADEAVLKAHVQKFSEACKKVGLTEADLLKGFNAEKKLRPDLTAREYLELPAFAATA